MKIWLKSTIFYGLVPVVLLACSSSGPKDYRTTDAINAALESSISSNQILESQIVPDKINQALLPGIQLDLPGQTGIDVVRVHRITWLCTRKLKVKLHWISRTSVLKMLWM